MPNFLLYEIVSKDDPRDPKVYAKPDEELFSVKDITGFSLSFCNMLIKEMEEEKHIPKPFLKYSDSNILLFGYYDQEYFFEECKDSSDYQARKSFYLRNSLT